VVDRAVVDCFLDDHDITALQSIKIYAEIDFLSSLAPQSASLYPSSFNLLPLNVRPTSEVCRRYRKIRLTADSWIDVGFIAELRYLGERISDVWPCADYEIHETANH
jgi:hypothetical protein